MRIASFILAAGCAMAVADDGQARVQLNQPLGVSMPRMMTPSQYISPTQARENEARLGLTRNDRRDIQRALQDLGYNSGYADGNFGTRTRAAISDWQEDNSFWPTGYVSRSMLRRMNEQLDDRNPGNNDWQHQADLDYWRQTGASAGNIEGMRRYLQRYPNGHYANYARNSLNAYDEEQRLADRDSWREAKQLDTIRAYRSYLRQYPNGRYANDARRRIDKLMNQANPPEDHQAWQRARQKDTIAIYERFLRDYPNSSFAREARARLKELRRPALPTVAEMRAEEERLLPNAYSTQRFMQGLRQLGYNPGPNRDGITEKTREVIRTIQRKSGRRVTGYVDSWLLNVARHAP